MDWHELFHRRTRLRIGPCSWLASNRKTGQGIARRVVAQEPLQPHESSHVARRIRRANLQLSRRLGQLRNRLVVVSRSEGLNKKLQEHLGSDHHAPTIRQQRSSRCLTDHADCSTIARTNYFQACAPFRQTTRGWYSWTKATRPALPAQPQSPMCKVGGTQASASMKQLRMTGLGQL